MVSLSKKHLGLLCSTILVFSSGCSSPARIPHELLSSAICSEESSKPDRPLQIEESTEYEEPSEDSTTTEEYEPEAQAIEEDPAESATAIYSQLVGHYIHTSGAGAWNASFDLNPDGSFTGEFSDHDVDQMYYSSYSGKFSAPVQVDSNTYRVTLDEFNIDGTIGEQYTKDSTLCTTTPPPGLEKGASYTLYMAGTPVTALPSDFEALTYPLVDIRTNSTLPDPVFVSEELQRSFVQYDY